MLGEEGKIASNLGVVKSSWRTRVEPGVHHVLRQRVGPARAVGQDDDTLFGVVIVDQLGDRGRIWTICLNRHAVARRLALAPFRDRSAAA